MTPRSFRRSRLVLEAQIRSRGVFWSSRIRVGSNGRQRGIQWVDNASVNGLDEHMAGPCCWPWTNALDEKRSLRAMSYWPRETMGHLYGGHVRSSASQQFSREDKP